MTIYADIEVDEKKRSSGGISHPEIKNMEKDFQDLFYFIYILLFFPLPSFLFIS